MERPSNPFDEECPSNPFDEVNPSNPFMNENDQQDSPRSSQTQPISTSAAATIPTSSSKLSYELICKQLINDGYILTALELHTEVQEIGKPVAYLRDYFSNPGNFERTKPSDHLSTSPQVGLQRSGSIQTFDSLDWARYSDDGDRQAEERVAGLEFELRKAQDTIKSLRKALTIATEISGSSKENSEQTSTSMSPTEQSSEPIKPHEKRAINFLVNEYLLLHDYKLSSITLAEENENQDFEHWDDVGLNISKPPDLLHLYLDYGKHTVPVTSTSDASTNDNLYKEELTQLHRDLQTLQDTADTRKSEATSLSMENESLQTEIELLKLEITSLLDKLEAAKEDAAEAMTQRLQDAADVTDSATESGSLRIRQLYTYQPVNRDIPAPFLNHILSTSFHVPEDNRIAKQVSKIDGNKTSTIVDMISQSLPHIVPNVLLAKREELLPLILCAANLHSSLKARDSMLNTLFNLIKRPDELQRQTILAGCVMFAQHNGPERVEEELLSQCWEQIGDRHMERRLLVVEACCALIPYMSSSIRGSLVLSMLQQMLLDERVDEVRTAIVRSLGILVCFIDDSDKFSQVLNLYGRHVLTDIALGVQEEATRVLLPSLTLWAIHIDRVSDVMELLFSALQNSLTEPNEENEIKVIQESFIPAIKHLHRLVNFQFVSLLYSGPYTESTDSTDSAVTDSTDDTGEQGAGSDDLENIFCLVSNRVEYHKLLTQFHSYTSEEWYKTWDQFDLLVYTTFSRFAMLGLSIQTENGVVVRALVSYIRSVCAVVGQHITSDKIEPKMSEFFKLDAEITTQHHKIYTSALLPMFLCGVKAAFSSQSSLIELTDCVRNFMVSMSEGSVPLQSLDISIEILLEEITLVEPLLDLLLEMMMKSSSIIKLTCAHLLEISLRCSNCLVMINSKILPGLVTLACDSESEVKLSTISPFASMLEISSERETVDKVYKEFIRLLRHVDQTKDSRLFLAMISIFSKIGPIVEPQFREEVVISQLAKWSKDNNSCGDTILRRDVALTLIDTYCALSCCFISNRIMQESFLPGLRSLQLDLKELALEGSTVIESMIRDMQSKLGGANSLYSKSGEGASSPAGAKASPAGTEQQSPRSSNRSVINKFMEKSAPMKMTSLFSKRK